MMSSLSILIILSSSFWWFALSVSLKSGSLYSKRLSSLSKLSSDLSAVSIALTSSLISLDVGPRSRRAAFSCSFLNAILSLSWMILTGSSSVSIKTSRSSRAFIHSFLAFSSCLKLSTTCFTLLSFLGAPSSASGSSDPSSLSASPLSSSKLLKSSFTRLSRLSNGSL